MQAETLVFLKQWAEECPQDRAERGATPEEVAAAEARLGYPFPEDYRLFISTYGSGAIGANPVVGLLPCRELSIHEQDIFIANAYHLSEWMDFQVTREPDEHGVYEVAGSHSMSQGVPDGAAAVEKAFGVKLPIEMHDFYRRWGGGYLMLGNFHYLLSPAEIVRVSTEFKASHGYKKDKGYRALYFCDLEGSNYLGYLKKGDRWKITYFHHELGHEHYLKEFDELPTFASSFYLWLYNTIVQDGSLPLIETDLRSINPQAPPFERLPLLGGDDLERRAVKYHTASTHGGRVYHSMRK